MTVDTKRTDRFEDFAIITDEIGVSLDDLLAVASDIDDERTAVLIASIAGLIQEKVAALTLICEEITNDVSR